jgi:SNF2 family DNA or RNA helicase
MLHLQEQKMQLSSTFIFASNPLDNLSAEEVKMLFE